MVSFLQAPVLAFIISYFLKYYKESAGYVFRTNSNLPAYIFMSVIVALFMGLTVAAEEIIHDRKILKRESFLHLSRSSYLLSKTGVMFLISAVQTLSFVIIGNLVFGIHEMMLEYSFMLFTVSCFANMLGLNISSAFDSVVTIYVLIPFLIIPQIILSGVIVKFENLNPDVTSQQRVPVIGEVMAARWAFEGLAVEQFRSNAYERNFFDVDKKMSEATFKKDFWLVALGDKLKALKKDPQKADIKKLFYHEINNELVANPSVQFDLNNEQMLPAIQQYFNELNKYYIKEYNDASQRKDKIMQGLIAVNGEEKLKLLKDNFTNESLNDMVLNANTFDLLVEHDNELIRRFRPVYMDGAHDSFIRAPFFVSRKNIFGNYYSTFAVNIVVIWFMTFILAITLYFNVLSRFMKRLNGLSLRSKSKD